jgi:hypothetical protein
VALTGTETFGTVVPGFVTNLAGSLAVTSVTAGTGYGIVPGFITDADGRLLVSTDTTGAAWVGGFIRNSNGALVITSSAPTDFGTIVPGFNTNSSGHLAMSSATGAVWVTGFLQNTNKSLAVAGYSSYVSSNLSPSIFLPLDATNGLADLSGNGRYGTPAGVTGAYSEMDGRQNLCVNPRAEVDTTGITTVSGTTTRVALGGSEPAAITDADYAFKYYQTSGGGMYFSFPATSGTTYTFSFWAYIASADAAAVQCLRLWDGSGNAKLTVAVTADDAWHRITGTVTADSTGTWRAGLTRGAPVAVTTWFTKVLIEQASSAGTYFPTTAQLESGEARWHATPYTPGPLTVGDTGATDFDGTDDRITTDYGTRRNYVSNPSFEVDLTGWGDYNAAVITRTRVASSEAGSYESDWVQKIVTDGGGAYQGAATASPYIDVTASTTYTASMWIKKPAGGSMILSLIERTAASATVGQTNTTFTASGEWERIEVTRAFGATGVKAQIAIQSNGAVAYTAYIDAVMLEQAASAGTYFDGTGYIDDNGDWISDPGGHVGWLGTAHASASDKGCFANGTTRTFMGWAYRDVSGVSQTLFSTDAAASNPWGVIASGDYLGFDPQISTGASAVDLGTWPGTGEWVHWAIVFNETTNAITGYLNGVLDTSTTASDQYPGAGNLIFGVRTATTNPFNGKMAWVSVHERGLTADEILAAYQAR